MACESPNFTPARSPVSRCGAFVIDSIPPATITSASPARISASASARESMPERQTLLTTVAGTLIGISTPDRRLPGR